MHVQANDLNLKCHCEKLLKLAMDRAFRRPSSSKFGVHFKLSPMDLEAIYLAKNGFDRSRELDEASMYAQKDHYSVNYFLFAEILYNIDVQDDRKLR